MKQFFSQCALVLAIVGFGFNTNAQTSFTAFVPEIGTTTCPASNVNFLAGVYSNLPSGVTFSGFTRNVVTCTAAGSHYRTSAFTSTTKANAISENRYVTWSFAVDATVNLTLNEVAILHERSAAGADNGALYYSVDGNPFEQVGVDFAIAEVNARMVFSFGSPLSIPAGSTITFRWYCWRVATTGSGNVRFRGGANYETGSGISGTFASTLPGITVNPTTLLAFNQFLGNPSAEQSFTVSGINLTENILITVPTGYEISLLSGSGFTSQIDLLPVNGTISNTTIYVRLNTSTEGQYLGDIEIGSAEVDNVLINLSGTAAVQPNPSVIVSPESLSNFLQFIGSPSDEQELIVSGSDLLSSILVEAPAGFEISLTSGSGFVSSIQLTPSNGEVAATTIYVRLNSSVVGAVFDVITVNTSGLSTLEVPISGSVEQPIAPMLGVSPEQLNPFLQNLGYPSATQILIVGGENLNGDISVVSTGNYFMSTSSSGPFSQSILLEPFGNYVEPTLIYVHLNASSAGPHNGTITITTADVTPVEIQLTGTAVEPSGSLLYYWHFNTLDTPVGVTSINADYSLVAGVIGKFDYTNPIVGEQDMDAFDTGTLLNAQMGEGSGKSVRVRNPSTNRTLDFYVPTNLASGITFTYAVQRSAQGMSENVFSYSIDGTNFITDGLVQNVVTVTTSFVVYSIDFTGIEAVNDNPNFRVRIAFNGNTTTTGNNRMDNITLMAQSYLGTEGFAGFAPEIYPNPANDVIQVLSSEEVIQITVIDLHGRVILTAGNSDLDVAHLQSGMYIMLIETASGIVQKSFVKR
jgi:hypothetical protein